MKNLLVVVPWIAGLLACGGMQGSPSGKSSATVCNPPPPVVSANALCLCDDFASIGAGFTTSCSTGGPANVGINGDTLVIGDHVIQGSLVAYQGLHGAGNVSVRDDLTTTGDLDGIGRVKVGNDLSVGGDVVNVGILDVDGTLAVAGTTATLGLQSYAQLGTYAAPAGPPCACDPSSLIDVAGTVAAARTAGATDIDALGLTSLSLTTGSYYVTGIASLGAIKITVNGTVNLYVDGDLANIGAELFDLSAGSTLNLWVAGDVANIGAMALKPGAGLNVLVGGSGPVIASVGLGAIGGNIYAPQAEVQLVGLTVVNGSLFARRLTGVGALIINYSQTVPASPGCGGSSGGGADGGPLL